MLTEKSKSFVVSEQGEFVVTITGKVNTCNLNVS